MEKPSKNPQKDFYFESKTELLRVSMLERKKKKKWFPKKTPLSKLLQEIENLKRLKTIKETESII